MNKIFNVNLGGYPFTMDEDAYHKLNRYLDTIAAHFAESEGCDEILEDIEARMAELFNDRLKTKAIVNVKDLEGVISIMGRPEDFGASPIEDEPIYNNRNSSRNTKSKIKVGKRLFRDGEEKVIGGVCSGIAAYFGITDPIWVRVGWFLSVIFLGIPLLIYPLLWVIVPVAKTAGDKLAMKGEPANISNIAKTVEDELNDLSNTINEMAKDLGSKKKNIKGSYFSPISGLKKGISLLGSIVLGVLNMIKKILKPFLSIGIGSGILILGVIWAMLVLGYVMFLPFSSYMGPSPGILSWLGSTAALAMIGIPIFKLMMWMTRWFSNYRLSSDVNRTLRIGWVASLLITGFTAFEIASDHAEYVELEQTEIITVDDNELKLAALPMPEKQSFKVIRFFHTQYSKKGLLNDAVHIQIKKATGTKGE